VAAEVSGDEAATAEEGVSRMTHAELIDRARRWLTNTRRCTLVATERNSWACGESPDAIGWRHDGDSVLVECKTTLRDFYADQRKPGRREGWRGMGRERWYLTPAGLLAGRYLPPGWGWLEVRGAIVRRTHEASPRIDPLAAQRELPLLVAMTRRALCGGFNGIACGVPTEAA
jgi:hypothetical protein